MIFCNYCKILKSKIPIQGARGSSAHAGRRADHRTRLLDGGERHQAHEVSCGASVCNVEWLKLMVCTVRLTGQILRTGQRPVKNRSWPVRLVGQIAPIWGTCRNSRFRKDIWPKLRKSQNKTYFCCFQWVPIHLYWMSPFKHTFLSQKRLIF